MFKAIYDLIRFNGYSPKERKIVFYSENESFYKFFSGIINDLIKRYNQNIYYVTSSLSDPILSTKNKKIIPFYIGTGSIRTIFFSMYNSPTLILTMPDLNSFHIKRSPHKVNYIFIPHNILSIHMVFRNKAFNHYDTFFCCGPHHNKEIKETEKIYNLKKINTINFGYNKIDELINNKVRSISSEKTLIICPSWGENCIIEKYGEKLMSTLVDTKWKVIVRPHPDTVRKFSAKYFKLKKKYENSFIFEEKISNMDSLYKSSLMISDWSGAAFEFAFGLEKPVIFIDVPKKVNNPDYTLYKNIPIEISIRNKIGVVIPVEKIDCLCEEIEKVFNKKGHYKKNIINMRNKTLYNIGSSSRFGSKFIYELFFRS